LACGEEILARFLDDGKKVLARHYQLDVLDPVVWTEEPDNRHSRRFSIIDGQLYSNNIAVEERQSFNDSDPLGLRPSIFSNNEHIQRVAQGDYEFFKEQSQLFVSSKSFNSKVFLRTVHLDTSYADLLVGAQKLRFTLDQKAEALKKLVHDNFDGFVSAKNTIDTVYNEMKAKSLNEKEDFGIRSLDVALTDAAVKAEQVFGPVLANRTKAEKIRSTLSVLEKFKFFFSLPSSLTDSLKH
ncbi:7834_t:CDS:2, partial [Paraglomus occultum]